MADTITEMNCKLDLILARMEEIDEIKEKQKELEKVSAELEKSLELAHESIKTVTVQVDAQAKTISDLEKGVNNLKKSASFENERTIKLGSHSRRNNLIFFGIPEEVNETSAKTESLLYSFLGDELKLKERVHRLGKRNLNGQKPRPIIAKFSFYKNNEFILSNASILVGTVFGISQDFPREIVETRRGLVKVL